LPKDIHKVFPQQTFQSIITRGKVPISVKGGDAFTIEWKTPLLFAGNWFPNYIDKGQISRRIVTANFEKPVEKKDVAIETSILNERPAIIYKCLLKYKEFKTKSGSREIWKVIPNYFNEQKRNLIMERNPLYNFLFKHSQFVQGHLSEMNKIRLAFNSFINQNVLRLDRGTFKMVDNRYEIVKIKICKYCNQQAVKECCEEGKHEERIDKYFVRNLKLNDEFEYS
jgi:hypothetical protein